MNLSQLEVLVAIVDSGSMTEAGEAVGLTQSAVSYSLSRLEAELGVTLLERGRHGVVMTRIGAEVVQHARTILSHTEAIRQKTARERGLTVGKLRFGCVPTIPPRLLTGILRDFQQRYPDIDVVLFEGTPRELVEWLETGVIDIGTVTSPQGYVLSQPFVHDEIKVIVSAQHPLVQRTDLTLEILSREPLIGPRPDYGVLGHLFSAGSPITARMRYEVTTQSTIFAMVREQLGAALVLNMLVDADAEGIVQLSLLPRLFVDIYLASNIDSPAAAAFLATASSWAKSHGFAADLL